MRFTVRKLISQESTLPQIPNQTHPLSQAVKYCPVYKGKRYNKNEHVHFLKENKNHQSIYAHPFPKKR